ncbi:MAG: FxsA family protein [Dermatophilaceae bacterium]
MTPSGSTPFAARAHRGWVMRWLFAALLIVPVVEIAVIVAVGRAIGGWQTLGLLVAESLLGAWLVRREGSRAFVALREALRSGRMPSRQLADAALVLVGGTLLVTPGFATDAIGFVFILPATRPLARRWLDGVVARRVVAPTGSWGPRRATRRPGPGDEPDVVAGEVVD